MKYKLSGSENIKEGKATTFSYLPFDLIGIKECVKLLNTQAIIPCKVKKGHRNKKNIEEIYPWIRLDVDVEGESEQIDKKLKNIVFIKKPSTNHAKYPYKWHYYIPIKNVSQNYDEYKLQYHAFLASFKIKIKDKSLASVVQNTNPMGEEGIHLTHVNGGKGKTIWKAPTLKAPKPKKLTQNHSSMAQKEVKNLLNKLSPNLPYDKWLRVGMALFSWCPKRGFKLYDKWSKKSKKYDGTTKEKWNDFSSNLDGSVTIGTLIHMVHGEKREVKFKKEEGSVKKKKEEFDAYAVGGVLNDAKVEARKNQRVLFENVVVERMHTFIYGSAGTNKTTIMGYLACNIVKNHRDKRVLFWSFDASQDHEVSIYNYLKSRNVFEDRVKLITEKTSNDYEEWYSNVVHARADLSDLIIIIDTFKFITRDVNSKGANKDAMHQIKNLLKLGATVVSLGHTNKDAIKQSGTAEIEQDSDAILRIDRSVDTFSGEVTLTITASGRCRFNCEGVTFKSKPKGSNYKYLYSALDTMKVNGEVEDLTTMAEKIEKAEKSREKDEPYIREVRRIIKTLEEDKNLLPVHQMIAQLAKNEESIGKSQVDRLLRTYNEIEWVYEPYKYKNGGRATKIYKLLDNLLK